MNANGGSCWCANFATVPIYDEKASCLCPKCLKKAERSGVMRDVTWRLWVAYDGSAYHGFQSQLKGGSIQEHLEEAFKKLLNISVLIIAAGRTDSGVHAHGQVISCRFSSIFDARRLVLALRRTLPNDIRVWRADEMPHDFDARNQSIGKRYVYSVDLALTEDPFLGKYRWNLRRKLNIDHMQIAAQYLIGEHDYESFRSTKCNAAHARRSIWYLHLEHSNNLLTFDIRGNAFCHNMIRIIVGTLVKVGLGKLSPSSLKNILTAKDRRLAGQTAPAQGLSLAEIYYPDDLSTAAIPQDAQFPRYPVTQSSWPFSASSIKIGPWLA